MIRIKSINEVYIKIDSDDKGILYEINEFFTFEVPGARFMPAYRNGFWDGKIRLFRMRDRLLYKGLFKNLENFCQQRKFQIEIDEDSKESLLSTNDISIPELKEFLKITAPQIGDDSEQIEERDYQDRGIAHALRNNRALILSPTGSGKSYMMFSVLRYLFENMDCKKALIIVPTVSLVQQIDKMIHSYSLILRGTPYYTHLVDKSQEKNCPEAKIIISTWQSVYKLPKKWFDQFDIVLGDEAHHFRADSLTAIMTKLENCKYRFGFTGTLDGTETHKLVLEGLFGPVMRVIRTKDLIDNSTLSDFRVKALLLRYPENVRKTTRGAVYQQEIDFIASNEKRNNFIKNLVCSRKGSTLVLYQMVEKHGKILYDLIKDNTEKRVFFIHGSISAEDREKAREIAEKEDVVIIASYGTFSTGINITRLHNLVFASPSKSRIRNLQSIGRVLRKHKNKEVATLYDIADDLSWKSWKNHTLKHFGIRIKLYNEEDFNYKIYNINLGS